MKWCYFYRMLFDLNVADRLLLLLFRFLFQKSPIELYLQDWIVHFEWSTHIHMRFVRHFVRNCIIFCECNLIKKLFFFFLGIYVHMCVTCMFFYCLFIQSDWLFWLRTHSILLFFAWCKCVEKNQPFFVCVCFISSFGKFALFYYSNNFDAHRIFLFVLKLQIFWTG